MITVILLSYIVGVTVSLATVTAAPSPRSDGINYNMETVAHSQQIANFKLPEKEINLALLCAGGHCEAETLPADPLSLVTRYVGVGYNLLKGNPEGDFNRGGIDPGILITKHILQFTYNQGKQAYYRGSSNNVPDQVEFHKFSSCATSNILSAYSGEKSYQSQLSVSVKTNASYASFKFSLNSGMEAARAGTEKRKRINIDKEEICALGRVRYLVEHRYYDTAFRVSSSFYYAIKAITGHGWNSAVYFEFLNQWGTHIILEADVGTRKINRSYLSYSETYNYLKNKNNIGISASGSFLGFKSSFKVDIKKMNEQIDNSSQKSERIITFSMGTEAEPLPVHMVLKPITEALAPEYWRNLPNGDTYQTLRVAEKKSQLERALREYPNYLRLEPLKDPQILIPNAWPDGTYALPETTARCPSGWSEGSRYQDTEDSGSDNGWSGGVSRNFRGRMQKNNLELFYCVKTDSAPNYGLEWPKGSYCIAKKDNCPSAFREGWIYWDDEDDNNKNDKGGVLPDGDYDYGNTRIWYCCRNDERPYVPITLPTDQPFILYRYRGTCQKVAGMNVAEEYIKFDDEDSNNKNDCDGAHPDNINCKHTRNHVIKYCYYSKPPQKVAIIPKELLPGIKLPIVPRPLPFERDERRPGLYDTEERDEQYY